MKKIKLAIVCVIVLALVLSMTACGEKLPTPTTTTTTTTTTTPTPTTSVEPTVTPEPTVTTTTKPSGGGSLPSFGGSSSTENSWDGIENITGTGTYTYNAINNAVVKDLDFAGTINVKNEVENLTVNMPNATINIIDNITNLTATTGLHTLNIKSKVDKLTILGGNVHIEKSAEAKETTVDANANTTTVTISGSAKVDTSKDNIRVETASSEAKVETSGKVIIVPTVIPAELKVDSTSNITVEVSSDDQSTADALKDVTKEGDSAITGDLTTSTNKLITTFEELQQAVASDDISSVKLGDNIHLTDRLIISNKDFTIDGNGYTISMEDGSNTYPIDVKTFTVVIQNVKFNLNVTGSWQGVIGASSGANLTLSKCYFDGSFGGTTVVNYDSTVNLIGNTFNGSNMAVGVLNQDNSAVATAVMTGNTFIDCNYAIYNSAYSNGLQKISIHGNAFENCATFISKQKECAKFEVYENAFEVGEKAQNDKHFKNTSTQVLTIDSSNKIVGEATYTSNVDLTVEGLMTVSTSAGLLDAFATGGKYILTNDTYEIQLDKAIVISNQLELYAKDNVGIIFSAKDGFTSPSNNNLVVSASGVVFENITFDFSSLNKGYAISVGNGGGIHGEHVVDSFTMQECTVINGQSNLSALYFGDCGYTGTFNVIDCTFEGGSVGMNSNNLKDVEVNVLGCVFSNEISNDQYYNYFFIFSDAMLSGKEYVAQNVSVNFKHNSMSGKVSKTDKQGNAVWLSTGVENHFGSEIVFVSTDNEITVNSFEKADIESNLGSHYIKEGIEIIEIDSDVIG